MKTIPFAPNQRIGEETIMDTSGLNIVAIRFNINSRELRLVVKEGEFTEEKLSTLSWQGVKKLVEDNNGIWTNKNEGIEFLTGVN